MQAIILAAGMGKRLKSLTKNNTKCMVEVNGVPLIKRMLDQLDQLGLSRIILVVGYQAQGLMDYVQSLPLQTPVQFVHNPIYERTNNIYSLYLAREALLQEDTLLLESDLIFSPEILHTLLDNPYPNLTLVAKYESWMDGTVVTLGPKGKIQQFLSKTEFRFQDRDRYYKTVNIYKFSKSFSQTHYVPFLEAYIKALGENEYYEQVLKVIALLDKPELKAVEVTKGKWYEIDDVQDLDIAESIFVDDERKWSKMNQRYGGFWRYPGLLDYCYLVNPYYPPRQLMDELHANLDILVRQYPSGLRVNNLLASKYFGVQADRICVGNGAAELINVIVSSLSGGFGVVCPTFEEYSNRYFNGPVVPFLVESPGFRYTAEDVIRFFQDKEIQTLCIINPDNPSGNLIPWDGIVQLLEWTQNQKIRLILDESFLDFSQPGLCPSLLDDGLLEQYPHLIVVKSISKSFGVPGLRLGIAASSDPSVMELLRKNVSIWNINSIGEFYLQIYEKYSKDYLYSLERLREERDFLMEQLAQISYLKPFPSQANYLMCQVIGDMTSHRLSVLLLDRFEILIKDLNGKRGIPGQYIRLAIRSHEENVRLIHAFREIE